MVDLSLHRGRQSGRRTERGPHVLGFSLGGRRYGQSVIARPESSQSLSVRTTCRRWIRKSRAVLVILLRSWDSCHFYTHWIRHFASATSVFAANVVQYEWQCFDQARSNHGYPQKNKKSKKMLTMIYKQHHSQPRVSRSVQVVLPLMLILVVVCLIYVHPN